MGKLELSRFKNRSLERGCWARREARWIIGWSGTEVVKGPSFRDSFRGVETGEKETKPCIAEHGFYDY